MRSKTRYLTTAAVIAALYVALTAVSALFGLDKGPIQLRLSEALTVLPCLTSAAIPGLTLGCLLSNLLLACTLPDMIFGSLATWIGAIGTYYWGRKHPCLAPLPPILANTVIIPLVLRCAYHLEGGLLFFALTVFIGELLCCGVLGTLLLRHMPQRLKDQL